MFCQNCGKLMLVSISIRATFKKSENVDNKLIVSDLHESFLIRIFQADEMIIEILESERLIFVLN